MVEEGVKAWTGIYRRLLTVVCLLFPLLATSADTGRNKTPFLLQFTDDAAGVARIGILRELSFPEDEREIRVWIGFGVLRINRMMRLRIGADGEIKGDILNHFDLSGLAPEDARDFRADILSSCIDWEKGAETETCFSEFRRRQNWNRIYKRLIVLGLDSLPDESELPALDFEVNDGVAMVVEILDGASYRAYQYSNPSFRTGKEAVAAQQIMEEVSGIMIRTKPIR